MHSSELIRWEPFEAQGIYDERPVVDRDILEEATKLGTSSETSLEMVDAVVSLLKDQVRNWIKNPYQQTLPSSDIRRLYETYTKLALKLQLGVPPMRFRDWEDLELRFADAQSDLDRKILGRPELEWFEEPVRIIREAVESEWAIELYSSIDASTRVGWPHVVLSMESLKRTFAAASGPDDYANVARGAKGVLEKLSDSLWECGEYSVPEGVKDGPQLIKNRLETVIRTEFEEDESKALVEMLHAANDFADKVRHRRQPSRSEAAIVADAALFFANTLWLAYRSE